jgi:uncharacterized protein HemX
MNEKQLNQEKDAIEEDPVDRLLKAKTPVSTGKPIAILALLIAFASVSSSAWHWWKLHSDNQEEQAVSESLAQLQSQQQQLAATTSQLRSQLESAGQAVDAQDFERQTRQLAALEAQVDTLRGQSSEDLATIDALQGAIRSLEGRLSTTESGLVSLAASSQNSRAEMDIAEIDFLLRTASARLSLFSDPAAADLALLAADAQLDALDDPMYLSVRQRIATARQALALMPSIDAVALTGQLSALQSKISSLPFRGEEPVVEEAGLADDAGWWESFKHTMSSLVTVRRKAPEDSSLLSLEDKDYLRQGLWLQLETARLALMRKDADGWSRSLERVEETLKQFFQQGSRVTQAYLEDTRQLKAAEIAPPMPDISAPWMQLRQLRDSRRLLQSTTPVEANDTEPGMNADEIRDDVQDGSSANGDNGQ